MEELARTLKPHILLVIAAALAVVAGLVLPDGSNTQNFVIGLASVATVVWFIGVIF